MTGAVLALGWLVAVAFNCWMLYNANHPVWAGIVAIVGAVSYEIKQQRRTGENE